MMTKTFKGSTDTSVFGGTVRVARLSKADRAQIRNFLADRESPVVAEEWQGARARALRTYLTSGRARAPRRTVPLSVRAGFFRVQDQECKRMVMGTEFESVAGTRRLRGAFDPGATGGSELDVTTCERLLEMIHEPEGDRYLSCSTSACVRVCATA
jgi:hypothetical protein